MLASAPRLFVPRGTCRPAPSCSQPLSWPLSHAHQLPKSWRGLRHQEAGVSASPKACAHLAGLQRYLTWPHLCSDIGVGARSGEEWVPGVRGAGAGTYKSAGAGALPGPPRAQRCLDPELRLGGCSCSWEFRAPALPTQWVMGLPPVPGSCWPCRVHNSGRASSTAAYVCSSHSRWATAAISETINVCNLRTQWSCHCFLGCW